MFCFDDLVFWVRQLHRMRGGGHGACQRGFEGLNICRLCPVFVGSSLLERKVIQTAASLRPKMRKLERRRPKEHDAFWILLAGPATSPAGEACVE